MLFSRLYTVCCARVSSPATDSTTCTREIMQQIVDFFSRNAHRERQHNALAQAIVTALCKASGQCALPPENLHYRLPENFIVEYAGCKVTFLLPGEHNPDYPVTIEVSREGNSVTEGVDRDRYHCLCTALLLRQNLHLPLLASSLTKEGRVNLREVDLNKAKLSGVSLPGVDLKGAKLRGALLSGSNLKGADLRNISAGRVTLDHSDLSDADLRKADLKKASVRHSRLRGADLRKADLRKADLWEAELNCSDLSDVNLESANLQQSDLSCSCLSRANLRGACLAGAVLIDASLNQSDLRASNLREARLDLADLRGANMAGCRMESISLIGANLNGAVLDDIPLAGSLLALPWHWDQDKLNVFLNHIDNAEGNLLTMMDSIDARYPAIKVKMARELITSLRQSCIDLSAVTVALMNVLSKAPWNAESDIVSWLTRIHQDYIQHNSTKIMQQVMDFFSENAHQEQVPQHNKLAKAIVAAFYKTSNQGMMIPYMRHYRFPNMMAFEYCGCKITFSFPEKSSPDSPATIEVSRADGSVTQRVDGDRYRSICTTLLIRENFFESSDSVSLYRLFSEEGRPDLRNFDPPKGQLSISETGLCMQGKDLTYCSLSGVDLQGAGLMCCSLSGANLRGAKLQKLFAKKVTLDNADLSKADLQEAKVYSASLREINLQEANLTGATLSHSDLRQANLRGAWLEKTELIKARLNHADLRASNLPEANFCQADLTGANLTGCLVERVQLSGAKLNGAMLDNIPLTGSLLALPSRWHAHELDTLLNHINNPASGSLLTMMDSIDEKYPQIKVKMARELMASLRHTDVSAVAVVLLDVLFKAPWSAESDISSWLNGICQDYFQRYNKVMPANPENIDRLLANLFSRHPALMHTFNGAFIQLVAQGMAAENDAYRGCIRALYDSYLNEESIRPWAILDVFGDYSGTGQPDWEDRNVANYIHTSSAPDGHVMLLSHNTLQGMLTPDPLRPVWHCFYLYNCQREELPPGREALEPLFEQHFPLFLAPYQYAHRMIYFHKLLNLLNLADLREPFLDATRQGVSQVKLVSEEQQQKLKEIFLPVLTLPADYRCCRLRQAHYCQIIDLYDLTSASDTDRARMLLCLAAVFTKYSSREIFGTEDESPDMVRFYACALMEQAYALDQDIFNNEGENQFTEWKNRLLGLNNAFSCSAVLSSMMIAHTREYFPGVLAQVLPPAWY